MIPDFFQKRYKIVIEYCKEKGWPLNAGDLTMDQILEIRALQEWKDAGK